MTTINNYEVKVTGADVSRAIKDYKRHQPTPVTAGMEMERFLLRTDGALPDAKDHDAYYIALKKILGDDVSVEPGAHMIEIKTGVHDNPNTLTAELAKKANILKEQAQKAGLIVLPSSDMPNVPVEELRENLISPIDPMTGRTRRTPTIIEAYNRQKWEEVRNYGTGTISIQFTHSVDDADLLHRWARVHSVLMPLYYAAFENRTRDPENPVHQALHLRRMMGDRCLIADYVFAAKDGDDFIDKYTDYVMKTKLYVSLDETGQDRILPTPSTFQELPDNRQTLGNFLQAASFSWGVCKIKPIIDEEALAQGTIRLNNLLLEVRDFDSSDGGAPAIAGWLCSITSSEERLLELEARLESLGVPVCSNPMAAAEYTRKSLRFIEDRPEFMAAPFGDPEQGITLRDVVKQIVLPMLKDEDKKIMELWKNISNATTPPFRTKALTGRKPREKKPGPSN